MQYRPNESEFLTNGAPDETKILKKLEGITKNIDTFLGELDDLHNSLSNIQHDLIIAVSNTRDSHRTRGYNENLTKVMQSKDKIKKLYDTNIYPLMFFINHADHLRMLKEHIKKDPYLEEKWNEVLLYMRLKETNNDV